MKNTTAPWRKKCPPRPGRLRTAPGCIGKFWRLSRIYSVEIIGVGPLRNLANLLSSEADSVSPLSGWGLIAKKVARLTLMAGNFAPDCTGPEWNVEMDLTSARLILETWPGEINLLGWEAGADVIALREPHALSPENPVAQAYRLYAGGAGRNSWDLCTVQWAMHPYCPFYDPSAPGLVTLDAQGVSRWRPMPGGRHRFLSLGRRAGGNRRGYGKNRRPLNRKEPGPGINRRAYAGCSLFHFSYSAAMTLSMGARPSSTSCTSASAETRASSSTAGVSVPMNS